jgi:hypothetical protein
MKLEQWLMRASQAAEHASKLTSCGVPFWSKMRRRTDMTEQPPAVALRLIFNAPSCPFVFEYDGDRIDDSKQGIGFAIDHRLVFDLLGPCDSLSDAMTIDPVKS